MSERPTKAQVQEAIDRYAHLATPAEAAMILDYLRLREQEQPSTSKPANGGVWIDMETAEQLKLIAEGRPSCNADIRAIHAFNAAIQRAKEPTDE